MTREMIVLENLRLDLIQRMKECQTMYNFVEDDDGKTAWISRISMLDEVCKMIDRHLLTLRREAENERP